MKIMILIVEPNKVLDYLVLSRITIIFANMENNNHDILQ